MSFDFSTLVTDRTQADVSRVKQIAEKIKNGTASESELAEFNSAAMKGAYNHTDLNRVTAAMEALKSKLEGYGYNVPGYQRIKVPHVLPEPKPTSRLPEGYTELTYIESTGTQHIDTGVKPNGNSRVVLSGYNLSASSKWVFGSWHNWYTNEFGFNFEEGSSAANGFRYGGVSAGVGGVPLGAFYLDHNGTTYTFNNTKGTMAAQQFTSSYSMYLFRFNAAGNASSGYFTGRIYFCRIYDNGTLVRDFVPCINPDGAVGLYDLVTAAFFGNSGTGSFVAGAIPGELLPYGYTQVEYIQSSGTQYIDTGLAPSFPMKVEMTVETTTGSSTVDKMVLASTDGTNGTVPVYWYNGTWYAEIGKTGGQSASGTLKDNTKYNVVFTATSSKHSLVVNGATLVEKTGSLTGSTKPLFLFARNNNGTASHFSTAKIYSLKLYSNGVLVRDYVPCKNGSGVVGLYDVANDVFYQNAGTGTFAAGEEVAAPATAFVMVASGNADEYDPYTWYEFDWPTPETMTVYLLNVSAIRAVLVVLRSTPEVPTDMERLMAQEANNIEAILLDVCRQLSIMPTTFIPCGEALCGGDNL